MPAPADEMAAALAQIRAGADRFRTAARAASGAGELADALRSLHDHRDPDAGVLNAVHALITACADALAACGDPRGPAAAEWLDEAASRVSDGAGEHIDRAREILAGTAPGPAGESR
ncbi:hypothetical protein [Streptomyces luteireticuli]|uniref:hypothetical protein n=1 Tax=Streptomyces luteireticuli TaxID=173858 RepID=UPI00355800D6